MTPDNSILCQIPEDDRKAAKELLDLYLKQSTPEQFSLIQSIVSKQRSRLGLGEEDSLLMVGIALRDAAATSALQGISMDVLLKFLDESLDVLLGG